MYEELLMIHLREWKSATPETPPGTEWMWRATQPAKAAKGGKSDLLCMQKAIFEPTDEYFLFN